MISWLWYHSSYLWYHTWYYIWYDLWYHWPVFNPLCRRLAPPPAPRCGSGLAATLPRLYRPGPALAGLLGPDHVLYHVWYYDIIYDIMHYIIYARTRNAIYLWYHTCYDTIYDIICSYTNIVYNIMYDIIQKPMISCMISYWQIPCATLILSKKHDVIYDIIL